MFKVGGKIRQIRLERGIEQSVLAERAGVSQGFISQVERGVVMPSLKTLARIAEALNVPVSAFENSKGVSLDNSILEHLDEETRNFLVKENSIPYIVFAKELPDEGVMPEDIETIKEVIKTVMQFRKTKKE